MDVVDINKKRNNKEEKKYKVNVVWNDEVESVFIVDDFLASGDNPDIFLGYQDDKVEVKDEVGMPSVFINTKALRFITVEDYE